MAPIKLGSESSARLDIDLGGIEGRESIGEDVRIECPAVPGVEEG